MVEDHLAHILELQKMKAQVDRLQKSLDAERAALEQKAEKLVAEFSPLSSHKSNFVRECYATIRSNPLVNIDMLPALLLEIKRQNAQEKLPEPFVPCDIFVSCGKDIVGTKIISKIPIVIEQRTYTNDDGTFFVSDNKTINISSSGDAQVDNFIKCVVMSCNKIDSIYLAGSSVYNERVLGFSDIEAFILTNDDNNIHNYETNFETISATIFGAPNTRFFYQPHWDAFFYPTAAMLDVKRFSEVCQLFAEFSLLNFKLNTKLLYGEDIRPKVPINYDKEIIVPWLTSAPKFHLTNAFHYINIGDTTTAAAALSRSILQTGRAIVWKKYGYTGASYVCIVEILKKNKHPFYNLASFALSLRKNCYSVSKQTLLRRAKQAKCKILYYIKKLTK